jgi:16S rRNA (guanine966-N2)-methyltransferase
LFDWLGAIVDCARVLDLFAGTGALGIEALSRGAQSAVFVESSRRALAVLRRNVSELGIESESRVVGMDVVRALDVLVREGRRFDLVFADPPFTSDWIERIVGRPAFEAICAPGCVFVAERSSRAEPLVPGPDRRRGVAEMTWRATKVYGEIAFDQYTTTGEQPA